MTEELKDKFLSALKELHKEKKRNFSQAVDLLINLRDFDIKKDTLNTSVVLPYPQKDKKILAFLENPSEIFDLVITKKEFDSINEKKIKKIIKDYDFCVGLAKLMPEIAKRFGKAMGPSGKMPDPKLGSVMPTEEVKIMKAQAEKLKKTIKIRAKENSVKMIIGKENMKDEEVAENCLMVYNAVLAALPQKKENIRSVMLKLTMSKPIKIKF